MTTTQTGKQRVSVHAEREKQSEHKLVKSIMAIPIRNNIPKTGEGLQQRNPTIS